ITGAATGATVLTTGATVSTTGAATGAAVLTTGTAPPSSPPLAACAEVDRHENAIQASTKNANPPANSSHRGTAAREGARTNRSPPCGPGAPLRPCAGSRLGGSDQPSPAPAPQP